MARPGYARHVKAGVVSLGKVDFVSAGYGKAGGACKGKAQRCVAR